MKDDPTARGHSQHPGGGTANAGKSAVATKAATIDKAQVDPLTWKTGVKRVLVVAVAGATIYGVLPKLIAVLGAWPQLSALSPAWFAAALAAEIVSFTCNFALQRLALRTTGWFAVVTAGLAGNAVTGCLPGGDAAGAAVQFRMLATAGFDTDTTVGGLTAFSLLGVGGLLALPVFALPAILGGAPVSPGLDHTALLGIAGLVLFAVFGIIILRSDWPLATAGRAAQRLRNWLTRGRRPPLSGLDTRLLAERDTIRGVLGRKWRQAVLLTVGRLGFDLGCLLAALRATGANPRPPLVLLAYAAAGILALLPLTPGGLGIVEASLSGLLILAGVHAGQAFLATLAYRIASYWLPLLAGPPAYLLFRHRYEKPTPKPAKADTGSRSAARDAASP
ncbi:MAG TPA: lysylphosphatidylglycerol synthase transmembrane domain-containing protein [Trebonia sp.]|nr:lysylphosphatidylglycerol synthase transmembrane domain-containing protein [Trebonia sp.]